MVTALWDYISLQYTGKRWLPHSIPLRTDPLLPANLKYKNKTSGALEGKYRTLGHINQAQLKRRHSLSENTSCQFDIQLQTKLDFRKDFQQYLSYERMYENFTKKN